MKLGITWVDMNYITINLKLADLDKVEDLSSGNSLAHYLNKVVPYVILSKSICSKMAEIDILS